MDPVDKYLSKRLKNLAVRCSPPADGRSRLLQAVAFSKLPTQKFHLVRPTQMTHRFDMLTHQKQASTWPIGSFDWSMIYSFPVLNLHLLL